MFRTYQATVDATGSAIAAISPHIQSMEWDIYQISVQTGRMTTGCSCQINHNGYFLCSTSIGSRDTATGPPDVVVTGRDMLNVIWSGAFPGDTATVGIWFNENPEGTTFSSAH